jgi:hypothetical protein
MRVLLRPFLFLALALALTGCVATELNVTNATGGAIQFYSGHTKRAVRIPAGATVAVPHTEGRLIIITGGDEVWQYASVSVLEFPNETAKAYKKVVLAVAVQPDGTLLLPSGKKIAPAQKLTPKP